MIQVCIGVMNKMWHLWTQPRKLSQGWKLVLRFKVNISSFSLFPPAFPCFLFPVSYPFSLFPPPFPSFLFPLISPPFPFTSEFPFFSSFFLPNRTLSSYIDLNCHFTKGGLYFLPFKECYNSIRLDISLLDILIPRHCQQFGLEQYL